MGFRESDGFPAIRPFEGSPVPDAVHVLLPDLERLLDISYVATLSVNQLSAKIDHLRTLTAKDRPQSIELKSYQSLVRENLLRTLFFQTTGGLLPDLNDLRDLEYLKGYPPLRLEKLLFVVDRFLLKDPHLNPDLHRALLVVRDKVTEACAAVLERQM